MRLLLSILLLVATATLAWAAEPLNIDTRYSDGIVLDREIVVSPGCELVVMEARAPFYKDKEPHGTGKNHWGIKWHCSGSKRQYSCTIARGNTDPFDFANIPYVELVVKDGDDKVITKRVYEDVAFAGGAENSLCVTVKSTGAVSVSLGDHELVDVAEFVIDDYSGIDSWSVESTKDIPITYAMTREGISKRRGLVTGWTPDKLDTLFATSTDPMEGYWTYLDRENDSKIMRPGGFYTIAIVSSGGGNYDIIYVDGAQVNGDLWVPGMLRGRLHDTRFVNHYNLEWVDATFDLMSRDVYADVEQGIMLTLSFPVYRSQMRFVKAQQAR